MHKESYFIVEVDCLSYIHAHTAKLMLKKSVAFSIFSQNSLVFLQLAIKITMMRMAMMKMVGKMTHKPGASL